MTDARARTDEASSAGRGHWIRGVAGGLTGIPGPRRVTEGHLAEEVDEARGDAHQAQCAVHAFTMGTVTAELGASFGLAFAFAPGSGGREDRWPLRPGTVAQGSAPAAESPEAEFEFSLNVLVEGLRARVAAQRPARSEAAAPDAAEPA